MANTVQANIEVNGKANISDLENKLSELEDKIFGTSDALAAMGKEVEGQDKLFDNFNKELNGLVSEIGKDDDALAYFNDRLVDLNEELQNIKPTGIKEVSNSITDLTNTANKEVEEFMSKVTSLEDTILTHINQPFNITKETIDQLASQRDKLIELVPENIGEEAFNKAVESIANVNAGIVTLTNNYESLNSMQHQSMESLEELSNFFNSYEDSYKRASIAMLEASNKNREAIDALRVSQEKLNEARMFKEFEQDIEKETQKYNEKVEAANRNREALVQLKEAQDKLSTDKLVEQLQKETQALNINELDVNRFSKTLNDAGLPVNNLVEDLNKLFSEIYKENAELSKADASLNKISESTKSVATESSNIVNATNNQANAFKKEEESLDSLIARMGHYLKVQNDIANSEWKETTSKDFNIDGGKELGEKELEIVRDSLNKSGESVKSYDKQVQQLINSLGISNNETVQFSKALGVNATEAAAAGIAIGVAVGILKTYVDMLKKAESDTVGLVTGMADLGVSGIEFFVDAIHSLIDSLEEVIEKMDEFAEAGAEIQTAYYNTFTILGEEAGENVLSFTEKLENLYGLDGDNLVKNMQSVIAAAGSLGVKTNDMVKATENMTLMAEDLSLIAGSFEKASTDIGNAISKGFIGRSSSLYVLMTKAEKDELKSLGSEVERYNYLMSLSGRIKGRYIDFLGTEAGQVMLLRNQYGILVNNISKLALGLYAKIAPVLTKLIQLANIALTYIMKVFNIDIKGGANIGGNNIADDIADSIGKVGDNAKTSGKAVDELKRKVASFDDVIQISDDKTDDGLGSELAELSDVDVSGIWDLDDAVNNLNDDWSKFRELLNNRDYYGAGQEIAKWLKEQMEDIPWDSIQAKARKAGAAIAEVLNGIIEDKDVWADFGHTIAQGLNTAVDFLLNFADLFNFRAFGEGLGVAWKQFWDEFDEIEAAEAIYEWFMGAIDVLGGFFESRPLNKMASSLVIMINKFFSSLTDEDITKIADTLIAIINDIFRAATRLMDGIEEGEAGEKIQKLLSEVFKKVSENAGFWGETLGNLIKSIYTFFYEALTNADKSGLSDSIAEFLSKLDLKGIFETWFKLQMELIWIVIESAIKTIIADIINKITGETEEKITKEEIFETISFILSGVFALVAEFIGEKIAENFDDIKENISKGLDKVVSDIGHWFENTKKSLKNKIDEILYSALQTVKGWIDKIKNAITEPFKGLNPFSGMNLQLPNFNISMPWSGHHATGGITNGASIGMIGEAGREAVLPLDRNTGWMDELASKINASNANANNAPVIIDMSKAVKPVYTRSEYLAMADVFAEALKARGVVVSMEY